MSKKTIYIIRDQQVSSDNFEELQDTWLEENYPDRIIIGGETDGVLLIDEEGQNLMCMETTQV